MKFTILQSKILPQNGDYETVGSLGGFRKFPEHILAKPNLAHLITWLTEERESPPGVIRLEDGQEYFLTRENRDTILKALGNFSCLEWGESIHKAPLQDQ